MKTKILVLFVALSLSSCIVEDSDSINQESNKTDLSMARPAQQELLEGWYYTTLEVNYLVDTEQEVYDVRKNYTSVYNSDHPFSRIMVWLPVPSDPFSELWYLEQYYIEGKPGGDLLDVIEQDDRIQFD